MASVTQAILRGIGTGLVVTAVLAGSGPAEAKESGTEKCVDKVLSGIEGGDNVDLEVKGPCEVRAGAHKFRNVSILQGGSLAFLDAEIEFSVHSIVIDSGGSFIAGKTDAPIGKNGGKLLFTFVDSPGSSCDSVWCGKGILVKAGGTLRLVGAKGVADSGVSWTHLFKPAGPSSAYGAGTGTKVTVAADGDTVIHLARDVTQGAGAWQDGDWIAVATTSFSPFETEFVRISGTPKPNGAGGTEVRLAPSQPLRYYHFGGNDPGLPSSENFTGAKSTEDYNYGVDERAEVGLITRSIKLTAQIAVATAPFTRGEITILANFKEVVIQGVELEKFGKAQSGSYPIGLDEAGTVTQPLTIDANSIHHSFNKCISIYSTSNVTVQNNVCARIVGHIFYLAVGDEKNIQFLNNLGLGAMSNSFDIHGAATPELPTKLSRQALIDTYWWAGDNLARSAGFNYDGLNVPNKDEQTNPTHGSCTTVGDIGQLLAYPPPPAARTRSTSSQPAGSGS